MAWDIRKNGSTSIGGSVLPDLRAVRGLAIGRTGVLPWAGRMSFTTDADVLTERDEVELLRDATVEWSGRVRTVSQATDRQIQALRWKITAQGSLSELIAVEAGASTERYDDITVDVALGHLLDAVGIGASRRDIGTSARELAYWQLLAEYDPWAEVRRLLATAGPRARLFEDRAGLIVFRDAALPALSRTLYGRAAGSGARAIITDIDREEVGRDRVVNVALVPYATTPEAVPALAKSSTWADLELAADPVTASIVSEVEPMTEQLVVAGYGAFIDGASGGSVPLPTAVRPRWQELYGETWSNEYGTATFGSATVEISTGDRTMTKTPQTGTYEISTADTSSPFGVIGDLPTGLTSPHAMTFHDGDLYIIDNDDLWRIHEDEPDRTSGDFGLVGALPSGLTNPRGMTSQGGDLYIVTAGSDDLWRINPDDPDDTSGDFGVIGALHSALTNPRGMTSHAGYLYIVDTGDDDLWRINPDDFDMNITLGDRIGNLPSGLTSPRGMTSHDGDLYIVDEGDDDLWRINPDDPDDTSGDFGRIGDLPTSLTSPQGMASRSGDLYIVDTGSDDLWLINPDDPEDTFAFSIGDATRVEVSASAAGTGTVAIPVGAVDVEITVTAIGGRRLTVFGWSPSYGVSATAFTLSAINALTNFDVTRSGQTITVTPEDGAYDFTGSDPGEEAADVREFRQYDVTLEVTWRLGIVETSWAGLYLGLVREQVEASLPLPAVANVTISAAINALRLSIAGGIQPAIVAAGDDVPAGGLLVSACVIESRIDDEITVTAPTGWTQVSGEPSGLDAANTRRILFVATQAITADGTVPAAVWAASGPSDLIVRSTIAAFLPARQVVWEDDAGTRDVPAAGLNVDVRADHPLVHLIAPVEGLDFIVAAGTITSVSVTTSGVEGAAARITIEGTSATIANLRLRGHVVATGEAEERTDTTSITEYGRSASRRQFGRYIDETNAGDLADDIIAYSDEPRRSWDTIVDADRSTDNMNAASDTDILDVQRVNIDTNFDNQGEVVRIEHRITQAAGRLVTRLTMLGT